jgi:hypothetical protein
MLHAITSKIWCVFSLKITADDYKQDINVEQKGESIDIYKQ